MHYYSLSPPSPREKIKAKAHHHSTSLSIQTDSQSSPSFVIRVSSINKVYKTPSLSICIILSYFLAFVLH
ncbi:hypothetical protein RIF29_21233 [Crotalaria pallida]|uniref:Uncharacterized protein n=1 Tax=Crotalaria pallida TaxID=3830 RepID=A0AAN9FB65_CROPI